MGIFKKALQYSCSAFFIALSLPALAQCPVVTHAETVALGHVYDGDTLRLKDGRRLRLIGINTPETAKEGQVEEFMAEQAKARLRKLLANAQLSLQVGQEPRDRHQRWLGYLFADGRLVAEQLLREGLGLHVAIAPNTIYWQCLKQAEQQAQRQGLGLWSRSSGLIKQVAELAPGESGFRLLEGRVSSVRPARNGYMLILDKRLAVKGQGLALPVPELAGKQVRVRGWVQAKKASDPAYFKPWFVKISHASQMEVQ